MATLVLTAVGTVVGGPIGGAIGALVGQGIDARLFAPKARQGPRLGDLAVQTSSYGTQIPKIFGTMRVAGCVIWATDLKETRSNEGGGKGAPKTTNYSYSASFAVALSGRAVRRVGRIWADGKLLRGSAGDFKSRTGFRLYAGDEGQGVDPLIAAVEGVGQASAFRGMAYAMFEDMQLEDFGNRIPSLTFEVEADAGPVTMGAIGAEIGGGAIVAGGSAPLDGFAASGDSIRSVIEALDAAVPLSLIDEGGHLRLMRAGAGAAVAIDAAEEGARRDGAGGPSQMTRGASDAVPATVSIAYHDAARDYQTGMQQAASGEGTRDLRIGLAASLGAEAARALAEQRLAVERRARDRAVVHLPWRRLGLGAGATVRLAGRPGLWRVTRATIDRMVVSLELVRSGSASIAAGDGAVAGRPIGHPDLRHGPTKLIVADLPIVSDLAPNSLSLSVAAAGSEAWRKAALSVSFDDGATWRDAGRTAPPATMGRTITILPAAGSELIDTAHMIEVELANEAMWLESRDDPAVANGANAALIGDEIVQFGVAQPIGPRRFRLSRLLRGRRGTEWAAGLHRINEPFLLIESDRIARIAVPLANQGVLARVQAIGLDDAEPVEGEVIVAVAALRPPAPVHLTAVREADGLRVRWTRRSRAGWMWIDGLDTPLGEESERYRVSVNGDGAARSATVAEPEWYYSGAEQAADGDPSLVQIRIEQIGTCVMSPPAAITIDLRS